MEKKGVSAIIYDNNGSYYFLILHRIKGWKGWEFPKGGIQEGESPEQAVVREIKEETGLQTFKVIKKIESCRNFENEGVKHTFDLFLVEASMNIPVDISNDEHDTYLWATHERVLEKLTWDEEREAFKIAFEQLKSI